MHINTVWAVFFSPTGTTEKAAYLLAKSAASALAAPLQGLNLTKKAARDREYTFSKDDLVIVASPTYAGRLPNKIAPDLRRCLLGSGALAVPVVLFGNRAFDNSLAELNALLIDRGFRIVAAGAFASRHAFTDDLGWGRPDWNDRKEMEGFGKAIGEKARALTGEIPALAVPGDPEAAYYVPRGVDGEPAKFLKAKPKTDLSRCSRCGTCARLCPMGAIDQKDYSLVTGTCIKCQSCVRRCTRQAKYFDDPAFLSHVAMLKEHFQEPKRNLCLL